MPASAQQLETFISSMIAFAIVGASIYVIGRLLHVNIGRNDDSRREHGRFIPEWVAGTYIAIGLGTLLWFGPRTDASFAAGELAAFGILIGLVCGWIHGSIRIRLSSKSVMADYAPSSDEWNPYRPPAHHGSPPHRDSNGKNRRNMG